eukprot:gene3998-7254_t
MEKAKTYFSYIFFVDIWKLPKQQEGSVLGLIFTVLYPIVALFVFIFLVILFLLPALGGNVEKTKLNFLQTSNIPEQAQFDLSLAAADGRPTLIYSKEREPVEYPSDLSDPCHIKPTVVSGTVHQTFRFCYNFTYLIFTKNPGADYDNGLIFGDLYQTSQTSNSNNRIEVIGNRIFNQSLMFVKVENYTKRFDIYEPVSYLNSFYPGEAIYETFSLVIKAKYDEKFIGQNSSNILETDRTSFQAPVPNFDCANDGCYGTQVKMDGDFLHSITEGTFGVDSLFGVVSSFGGVHSIMSLTITTFVLIYLRIWSCVLGDFKIANTINRPTAAANMIEKSINKF